jgi:predicted secreted protein
MLSRAFLLSLAFLVFERDIVADDSQQIVIGYKQNNQEISVNRKDKLIILLPCHPDTGVLWQVTERDPDFLMETSPSLIALSRKKANDLQTIYTYRLFYRAEKRGDTLFKAKIDCRGSTMTFSGEFQLKIKIR